MNAETSSELNLSHSPLTLLIGIIIAVLLIPVWIDLFYTHPMIGVHAHLSIYLLWLGTSLATIGAGGFFAPQRMHVFGCTRFLQLGAMILTTGALFFIAGSFISETPSEQMRDPALVFTLITVISLSYAALENMVWYSTDDNDA